MGLFDFRLEQWRDRYGLFIGAALILATLAGLVASYGWPRPSRLATFGLFATGLGLLGVLFLPAAPHIANAVQQLAVIGAPKDLSGPFSVGTFNVALPPPTGGEAPIIAQIWHPAEAASAARAAGAPVACAQATKDRRLPQDPSRFQILLYAPGNAGGRDDNASTSSTLASHGYVVMAIDDIELDRPSQSDAEGKAGIEPLAYDFSSDAAFEKTLRGADRKVRLEAEKALAALDRLQACASVDWKKRLDFDHVGIFGFSFGGAVAAEAGVMDKRIAAAANLDGWLFGRAAAGALEKPYMIMNSDAPIPRQRQLRASNPGERNSASLTLNDLREEIRLASRPDGYWFWVKGSKHEGYSDQIFDRRDFSSWMALNPIRMKEIRDAYLRAFFDAHLAGTPRPLLRQTPSPYGEVELLEDSAHRLEEIPAAPASK
jgi:dienelactone hydrolase